MSERSMVMVALVGRGLESLCQLLKIRQIFYRAIECAPTGNIGMPWRPDCSFNLEKYKATFT